MPLLVLVLALAGGFAASATGGVARSATGHGARSPVRWSAPRLIDHAPRYHTLTNFAAVACPTETTCLGVGSDGTVVSITAAGDRVTTGVDNGALLQDISCPSASLCVAAGKQALLVSSNPTAPKPSWRPVHLRLHILEFDGVTCASTSLCVAWLDSGTLRVSTDPAGGAQTWRSVPLRGVRYVDSVACAPSSTLCVASTGPEKVPGTFATSTNPAGGPGAWRITHGHGFAGDRVVCPSSSLCVADQVDSGLVETSTNPAAGAGSWRQGQLALRDGVTVDSLDCATAGDCVLALSDGSVATTTDAAVGAGGYQESAVLGRPLARFGFTPADGIACPTASTCFVVDGVATVITVSLGPPPTATSTQALAGRTAIAGLSCPSVTLCVGVDGTGAILRTDRPAGPAAGWQRVAQPRPRALAAVSCPSVSFCAAVGSKNTVRTTSSPGTAGSWRLTTLKQRFEIDSQEPPGPFRFNLESVSCPSRRLCVAGTDTYGLVTSTDPAAGPSAWRYSQIIHGTRQGFDAISCPTTSLCVAGDDFAGLVAVSTRPAAGAAAWKDTVLASARKGPAIRSVACPTATLCIAGDGSGAVYSTTRPTGGRRAWHRVKLEDGGLYGAFCRSRSFCVVIGAHDAFATTHPTGSRAAWHRVALPTGRFHLARSAVERLAAVACAPTRLCLAANETGSVFAGAG